MKDKITDWIKIISILFVSVLIFLATFFLILMAIFIIPGATEELEDGTVTITSLPLGLAMFVAPFISAGAFGVIMLKKCWKTRILPLFKTFSYNQTSQNTVNLTTVKNPTRLSSDAEFAQYVLNKYGGGCGPVFTSYKFQRECDLIMSEDTPNPRIHILMEAANRLEPKTERETYIKVQCCIAAGASGFLTVIDLAPSLIEKSDFSWEYKPEHAKWSLQLFLVRIYERRRMWEESIELRKYLHEKYPWEHNHVEGLVHSLNALGRYDESIAVIEEVRSSTYYNMSGIEYHMDYWSREYERSRKEYRKNGLRLESIESKEEYLKRRQLPNPPVNLLKKYTDIAELTIASSIVSQRNRNDYEWIKNNLPEISPKSYSGYKRMKNQKTKNFLILAANCLDLGRNIQVEDDYTRQDQKLSEIRERENAEYWERRNSQQM